MSLNVGDLVVHRLMNLNIGVVVDKRLPNEGLNHSAHVRHLLQTYPRVYYVYFAKVGRFGPVHESELVLQQSIISDSASTRVI